MRAVTMGVHVLDVLVRPVEAIRGCYTNVVGLPLCAVNELLAEAMGSLPAPEGVCLHAQGWISPPLD